MAQITLKHIYKIYGNKVPAVKDFNLDIEDHEFIVFVGPSGCGKSTTLRMIAGLEEISEGDFYIGDRRVNDVSPKDRNIAMVFQNYALYPHMTVFDNMAFGLKLRKTPKDEIKRRVEHAAEILGLEPYLKRKPKALSGGQRQRVALGRAIVREADVFLMDEPLSNLDAKLRVKMRAEIIKLHQRLKTTTIYVTHDQTEAMTMASRIVVMKDGVIQQVGTPKEVYEKPHNKFVAGFIGSPAMNFFDGRLERDCLVIGGVKLKVPDDKLKELKKLGYQNKELTLGVRPENIHEQTKNSDLASGSVINAEIEVSELMGAETMLYSSIAGLSFIARVDSGIRVTAGQKLPLYFDMNKSHFFDIESEEKIDLSSENELNLVESI
ncbi:ABC transporter ATP-binding protein [Niallia sp. 03133]|uniref:ABC transporter ATP-binding protein n=1 Tax=Niallia sp. 03133 TaxID=3458060 RepID=UPI0040441F0B